MSLGIAYALIVHSQYVMSHELFKSRQYPSLFHMSGGKGSLDTPLKRGLSSLYARGPSMFEL